LNDVRGFTRFMSETVFISYSHKDRRWLDKLRPQLEALAQDLKIDVWDDTRIEPGRDWGKEIQSAIDRAKAAVLLISSDFLASGFIDRVELPALLSKAEQQGCLILPLILRPCLFPDIHSLQRFQAVNSPGRPLARMKLAAAEEYLAKTAKAVSEHFKRARRITGRRRAAKAPFERDPRLEAMIHNIGPGKWDAASRVALGVVADTAADGSNALFERLFAYQLNETDDDRLWGALQTMECCVRIAPWLISHRQLAQLAAHRNLTVRSSAAVICMDLAHCAPHLVPLDVVLRLSVHDEDWYVQVPANSALKAMARTQPGVLEIFFGRLRSAEPEAREHAAAAFRDIALKEPDLLDGKRLRKEIALLRQGDDGNAVKLLKQAIVAVGKTKPRELYRYAF
jgi:hypothetical protein